MMQVLELIFTTAAGRQMTLAVDEPRTVLSEADVREAMTAVLDARCFALDGLPLTHAKEARLVEKTVRKIA